MIQRPTYIYISEDAQLGGIFGKLLSFSTFGMLGKKKKAYDKEDVAAQVAQNIANEPPAPALSNNGKMILAGGAAVALVLLLSGKPKYGR